MITQDAPYSGPNPLTGSPMQCPNVREGLCCADCRRPLGVGRLRNQLTLTMRVFTKKYYAVSNMLSNYTLLCDHMG